MNKSSPFVFFLSLSSISSFADTASLKIMQEAGENMNQVSSETQFKSKHDFRGVKMCRGKNGLVSNIIRDGQYAYKHSLDRCAVRAEIRMKPTKIGETYWQKWSIYIPKDYAERASGAHILAQLSAYPKSQKTSLPCQGVGHHLGIDKFENGKRKLIYSLQASNNADGNSGGFCNKYTLTDINKATKGRWIDFIQHAKFTGNKDGFLKLWVKIDGIDANFKQKINYHGATWWNDENLGPVFKMGLYKGGSTWRGGNHTATIYTDSYKLIATPSHFNDLEMIANLK